MAAKVIAFANQKGGVGKTTSSLTVAAGLAELGQAVLVVDLDPQACLTFSLGYDPDEIEPSLHDTVVGRASLVDTIIQHDEVDLAPANIDLAGAEITLLSRTGREYLLRGELADLLDSYDTVIIDCPPSLGVLTINGLTAADEVVIPVQPETLSHRGVAQLLETIQDVKRLTNRNLVARGVIVTLFDSRTRHTREVLRDLLARYGLPLIGAPVHKSIRFAEAPTEGASILQQQHSVPGAAAYRAIAHDLAGLPIPEDLLAEAGWDPERRRDVLGLAEGDEADAEDTADEEASDTDAPTDATGVEDSDGELEVIDLDARSDV